MKKYSGFSLIELSVVLLIIGLLLITSFESSKYFLIQNHIKATNVKLNAIQRAIEIYVRRTGHLPCPAPLGETSGSSNTDDCSSIVSDSNKGIFRIDNILTGAVPYRDLDLTADLSHDSWGGKFIYTVYLPAAKNIRELEENTGDYLIIYENERDENKIVTENAIYSLVSMGKNKYGAYNFNTNKQLSWENADGTVEQVNGPDHYKQRIVYFTDSTIADDIVRYKTKAQLIDDVDLEDLSCCINNKIINKIKESFNISTNLSFGDTFDDIECSFLLYNEELTSINNTDKYKLKCFKYGRLGILKVN